MTEEEKQTNISQNPEMGESGYGISAENSQPQPLDEQPDVDLADLGSPDLEAYAQAMAAAEAANAQEKQNNLAYIQQELATKTKELDQSNASLEEAKNQYARLAADFENFRKRTQKEKEELETQIKCSTLKELLPVVDNFERARSAIKPQSDAEMNIHKSYQSVYKLLVDCLKRAGVSPMRPEGEPFDPHLHEAVLRETTDTQPDGTVIEELVRGYMVGDKVLRHSMVKVAVAPEVGTSPSVNEPPTEEGQI